MFEVQFHRRFNLKRLSSPRSTVHKGLCTRSRPGRMFGRTRRRRLQPVAGAAKRHLVAKLTLRGTRRLKAGGHGVVRNFLCKAVHKQANCVING
jgi:hypothetical protein